MPPSFGLYCGGIMKFFSILKAIASGLVWGLGQLLNRQYLKALFFFAFFALFVSIEYVTSDYFGENDPYSYIVGKDFGDDYFGVDGFLADYYYNSGQLNLPPEAQPTNPKAPYQPFEDFLIEIGGDQNFTEARFIEFMARDLKATNPIKYKNIVTSVSYQPDELPEGINASDRVRLFTTETLWLDADGIYYLPREAKDENGNVYTEYVETTVLTHELNEDNILLSRDGLLRFEKQRIIQRSQGEYFLRISLDGARRYLNLSTLDVVSISGIAPVVPTEGPIFKIGTQIYDYFEPGMYFAGQPLQYKSTSFTEDFRQNIQNTYSRTFNNYNNRDYTRLMIKVYLELNPEIKDSFIDQYGDFFYEQAGLFVKGYWSVITLGVAEKITFTAQRSLMHALIGSSTSNDPLSTTFQLSSYITPNEEVAILGHVTLFLLIEGLISIILSLFFFIVLLWSVRDAYKVSEAKRNKEKVLKGLAYFKNVYETSFEYIILFPAIFVLGFISIMPIAFGFIIAFTDIRGGESQNALFNWVGMTNFFTLFNFTSGLGVSFGQAFWRVLGWTIVWAILSTVTVFFGGFFQALILNSEKVVFRKLWRTILILPWAIPALLSQMVFAVMFNENGFINAFLYDIGVINILQDLGILGVNFNSLSGIMKFFYLGPGDKIQWFTNPYNKTFVRGALVVLNIWLGFPYFMALMTGVMTAIDATLYEAADIDGANKFQKISQITMPLVLYSTAPILIMTFSGNFNNFGVIYFITGGGPNTGKPAFGFAGDTDILISWMYQLTVTYSIFNMASVFSVLIFLFVGSVTAWNLSRTRAFQED